MDINVFLSVLLLSFFHAVHAVTPVSERLKQIAKKVDVKLDSTDPSFPTFSLPVPVDHFPDSDRYEPHDDGKFNLRYWFDASDYKAGGPVVILLGGETSGQDRFPFLEKGILKQLAQATNGIGVILEHRYYGGSWPTEDLSTKNLRFLTTEQALADVAYFAKNVQFKGFEKQDLTAPKTPYIVYGGSYAGAQAAFLRVEYPDVFWGTMASSGVTKAIYDYWEYYEAVRIYADQKCIKTQQKLINIVDNTILGTKDPQQIKNLKNLFGLGGIKHDDDFANTLSIPIGGWQSKNWDPAVNSPQFDYYCGNITADDVIYPNTEGLEKAAKDIISAGGYGREKDGLLTPLLNFVGYLNLTSVSQCDTTQGIDACFTTHNTTFYEQDDITQEWRSWPYQYCTEYGYLQTGSGVPKDQLPLISRLVDLEYTGLICKEAFGITTPPDVDKVNKYGGFDIEYSRLAILDGEADPWRWATPHAPAAKDRKDSIDKPFIQIAGGAVHHWDENGVYPEERRPGIPPKPVDLAQRSEIKFVKEWLKEFKNQKPS